MIQTISSRVGTLAALHLTWRDVLDIALLTVVIYNLLLLIRGTRAVQMVLGILLVFGLYAASLWLQLTTLRTVLREVLFYLPFAIIVLFAGEIRRALASFGSNPFLAWFSGSATEELVSDLTLTASSLAARRVGALIVLERREGLKTYIENGVLVDAEVSYDLLVNIFEPGTPLHDGAVIISNHRVASAASFLPLSQNPELSRRYGTRHRAAVGISEETDALAIVVSEERGTIAAAVNGTLTGELDAKKLRDLLYRELGGTSLAPKPAPERVH
jgi:diadenylate cyclase